MRGAFAAPDLRWPDASALPARLRMGGAVAQLVLVMPHVIVSEYVMVKLNKVKNKDDWSGTGLHRPVRRRAGRNYAMSQSS